MKTTTNPTPQTLHELRERVKAMTFEELPSNGSALKDPDQAYGVYWMSKYIFRLVRERVLAILDSLEVKDAK